MKKINYLTGIILFFSLFFLGCSKDSDNTPPTPDPTPNLVHASTGFATQNGGTTGGNNGNVVTVTNFNQLRTYLTTPGTFVVKFNQRIYNGEKGGSINVASNKTLLGEGSDAFLDGIGLTFNNVSNIIVRNVKFTLNSVTNRDDPSV